MDEFESINSRMPDLGAVLAQRIAAKNAEATGTTPAPGTVDPYKLMLQRKSGETTPTEIDPKTIVKWPDDAMKKLQDYCASMGILGFNCGRMHPLAALAMLKKEYGDDYTNVPLEERVPSGHQKMGTHSGFGPNYPYSQAMNKKQILHG